MSDSTIIQIMLGIPTIFAAFGAMIVAIRNGSKADHAAGKAEVAASAATVAADKVEALGAQVIATKEHINSRMTELIATITSEQRLRGIQEGIAQGIAIEQKRRADEIAAKAEGHALGLAEGTKKE